MNTYSRAVQQGSVVVAVIDNKIEQGASLISIHSSQLKSKPSSLANHSAKYLFKIWHDAICLDVLDETELWVKEIKGKKYLCCHREVKLGELVSYEVGLLS